MSKSARLLLNSFQPPPLTEPMQNTRLNTVFSTAIDWLVSWLRNPWRRLSVLIISLLFGNFLGIAISSVSGQQGTQDIVYAVLLTVICEFISWVTYRNKPELSRSLLIESTNAIKIGLTYGLFLEGFKLGS